MPRWHRSWALEHTRAHFRIFISSTYVDQAPQATHRSDRHRISSSILALVFLITAALYQATPRCSELCPIVIAHKNGDFHSPLSIPWSRARMSIKVRFVSVILQSKQVPHPSLQFCFVLFKFHFYHFYHSILVSFTFEPLVSHCFRTCFYVILSPFRRFWTTFDCLQP